MEQVCLKEYEKGVKLGDCLFRSDFFYEVANKISEEQIESISKSKQWTISLNQQWVMILNELQATSCESIQIFQQFFDIDPFFAIPKVIQILTRVNFTHLKRLNLSQNFISSLQVLAFFSMNQVQEMDLQNNFITCLKPFQKTKYPHIHEIDLNQNPILDLNLNRSMLKNLRLLPYTPSDGELNCQITKATFFKIQAPSLESLGQIYFFYEWSKNADVLSPRFSQKLF